MTRSRIRSRYVRKVYATQNNSRAVRRTVTECLRQLEGSRRGLNVGSGDIRLHDRVVNLDVVPYATVDCLGRAEQLPFPAESFSLVVTQDALEHVADPWRAVAEVHRVVERGGTFYCQLPFVIGYHPVPTDYWRFTVEGIRTLVESAGFQCEKVEQSVGGGTGMYRIAVEFVATLLSTLCGALYLPSKGAASLILAPLKLLDPVLARSPQRDRIPGGYFVVAKKH